MLDEHDLAAIRQLKSASTSEQDYQWLRKWWGRRCGMEQQYVRDTDIAEHFVLICHTHGLADARYFFSATKPSERWKYGMTGCPETHAIDWLAAACSAIRASHKDQLPGFEAYMETHPHAGALV